MMTINRENEKIAMCSFLDVYFFFKSNQYICNSLDETFEKQGACI